MPVNGFSSFRDSIRQEEVLQADVDSDVATGSESIPFPRVEEPSTPVTFEVTMSPADSQETSSSKQTSSDKLSALPATKSVPNTNRFLRSPISSSSNFLPKRGYRRSLDASVSLPSFYADLDMPHVWSPTITHNQRANSFDQTPEKGTPRQRVSFDSDRGSLPTVQSVRQAPSRVGRVSDPTITSPVQRSSAYRHSQQRDQDSLSPDSRSPSRSRSRAPSPLRLFQQWSAGRHRHRQHSGDPFVPVDPYKFKVHFRLPCFPSNSDTQIPHVYTHTDTSLDSTDTARCGGRACMPASSTRILWNNTRIFLGDTLPREVYLNILLRLPAMYFSRVARIFQDAEVSRPDIYRMIESGGGLNTSPFFGPSTSEQVTVEYPPTPSGAPAAGIGLAAHLGTAGAGPHLPLPFPDEWTPPHVSPALIRFKNSWEVFVDSLIREWKTLNVVSALLLSAILTMFQIQSAADDPITRNAAFLSLICALMSLSYGCMYIVRFGTMRSMFRAAKWAEEARKTKTVIWWNVWVLLAMPAVWMSWAMVLFIASILSFVWRTGSVSDPDDRPPLSEHEALGARLAVTGVFALGMIYFVLIVRTLKSYGVHENLRQREPAAAEQTARPGARDGGDVTVERRGRERQRRASGSRRREETPEIEPKHREESCNGRKEKGGLRSILGLGIMGIGTRENGRIVQVDLEKGDNLA